jgi:tetratricopeptide (TPR) repeat protein
MFEFWANAGSVFYLLSRDAEALAALDRANQLFGEDPNLHLIRGEFFAATGNTAMAEQEFRTSLNLQRTDAAWYGLARLYATAHRFPEAAACLRESAKLSIRDYDRYLLLAQVYLTMGQPLEALDALDRAARRNPFEKGASALGTEFNARLAEGRCRAWAAMRDFKKSEEFARQALSFTPQNPQRWLLLADIYAAEGKPIESARARQNALALATRTAATPVPTRFSTKPFPAGSVLSVAPIAFP